MSSPSVTTSAAILYCERAHHQRNRSISSVSGRRQMMKTLVSSVVAFTGLGWNSPAPAFAENWGTHSLLKERYFMPELSPEDSVARIRQTAQGLHRMREMLENMSWRYVLFYIRQKRAYLSKDLNIATDMLHPSQRDDYIKLANEFIDNFAMLDFYVRTPKVYESMLYYERAMKNLDEIVAIFV